MSSQVQRSAALGARRLGVVHLRACLKKRQVCAIAKRAMYACQTSARSGGVGPHPQNQSGCGGGAGPVGHLQADERAAPPRPRTAGAAPGVHLRDGMPAAPGLELDAALVAIIHWAVGSGQVVGAAQRNLAPCRRGRPVLGCVVGSAEQPRPARKRTTRQSGSSAMARLSGTGS